MQVDNQLSPPKNSFLADLGYEFIQFQLKQMAKATLSPTPENLLPIGNTTPQRGRRSRRKGRPVSRLRQEQRHGD